MTTNCPFYGRHLFRPAPPVVESYPFLLVDQKGNQCALVTDVYSPCLFSDPRDANWNQCPRVRDVRL